MRRGFGLLARGCCALLGMLAMTTVVAPTVSAEPECQVQVAVRPVTLTVDGEDATGQVYEPYRCAPGDLPPRDMVTAVHGHDGSAADYAGYDIVAATHWYKDEHRSIARTVLWGWSQGGTMSGLAVAHGPRGLFDYWVDNYGPADDFTMWAASAGVDPKLPAQIEHDAGGCPPVSCPQAYVERSAALLASGRRT